MGERAVRAGDLAWGVAGRPLEGETVSGDAHAIVPVGDGALVAVADGLGHGEPAAGAARAALEVVERHAADPLAELVRRCHTTLRRTRGAALTLVRIAPSAERLEWIGVGNVDARVVRAAAAGRAAPDEALLLRGGVVGYRLPELRSATVALAPGDTLAIATDGLERSFADALDRGAAPQELADALLAAHGRPNDDALVVVSRAGSNGA